MNELAERNTEIALSLRGEFPATDKKKREDGAEVIGRTLVSFERKMSGSPVEVRPLSTAEAAKLAEEGFIGPTFFNQVLKNANIKAVNVTSDTPVTKVPSVAARFTSILCGAFEDLKLNPAEKKEIMGFLDLVDDASNALRQVCAEEGTTRIQ